MSQVASTESTQNPTWLKVGGVLGLAGGSSLALWLLYLVPFLLDINPIEPVGVAASVALGLAGGILALTGRVQIAPWLLAASWLGLTLTDLVISGFDFLLLLTGLPAYGFQALVDFGYGLWAATALWGAFLGKTLILAAFILTLVAFVQAQGTSAKPKHVPTRTGVAAVDEFGNVPPGWYPDPDGKPSERYYNGENWTEQSRPMTAGSAVMSGQLSAKPTMTLTGEPISPKSRAAAAILCWFLGIIGVHRFYVGKVGTGIAQIFTLGGLGVWALVDFIWILTGTWKDKDDRVLANW